MSNKSLLSLGIKEKARELGFDAAGITDAKILKQSKRDLRNYLEQGRNAGMSWLKDTAKQRSDPKAFYPGTHSVVMVALNYFRKHEKSILSSEFGTISLYARGRDYHKVLRKKLKILYHWIQNEEPTCNGRIFVDSFPIMEKPLAVRAGLGWIGKNSTLLIKGKGSYFFLGGILLNLTLKPDLPYSEQFCGSCNKCQSACPTGALDAPYQLDSRKCISYLTIEHQSNIANGLQEKMKNLIFGCDICQIVCPWNRRFAKTSKEEDFKNRHKERDLSLKKLGELSREEYEKMFEGTAVRRSGYAKFLRNVRIAQVNGRVSVNSE
jgi:epoxyqueuosine reductase